jgi:hypothetical protein
MEARDAEKVGDSSLAEVVFRQVERSAFVTQKHGFDYAAVLFGQVGTVNHEVEMIPPPRGERGIGLADKLVVVDKTLKEDTLALEITPVVEPLFAEGIGDLEKATADEKSRAFGKSIGRGVEIEQCLSGGFYKAVRLP